ncbi:hypothetical protein [Actinoplanes philippinensis]|uniref:hypothetical protein n=1 Tax=Actinoplanes philippinensis TaxID=35752 RepID=UPI0033D7B302
MSVLFDELRNTIGARLRDLVARPARAIAAQDLSTIPGHAGDNGPGGLQNSTGRAGWNDTGVDGWTPDIRTCCWPAHPA